MNAANWLQRTAIRTPTAPAFLEGERLEADYAEFTRRAVAVGAGLRAQYGIQAGDRVVIFLKNHTRYLELMYGAWFIGAVVVPANAKLHSRELAWIVANSQASIVLCAEHMFVDLSTCLDATIPILVADRKDYLQLYMHGSLTSRVLMHPENLLWLFYICGTTGRPKGVIISCGKCPCHEWQLFRRCR